MNYRRRRGSLPRCAGVWTTATAALVGLLRWLGPELHTAADLVLGAGGPPSFETMLVAVATTATAGSALWLWVVTSLTAAEAATGLVRQRAAGCPAAWRRVVLAACGMAAVSGLAVPAHAVPIHIHEEKDSRTHGAALLNGLPLPERPTGTAATSHRSTLPADRPGSPAVFVVRTGDNLWSLAAASLSPGASAAEITRRWKQIYTANRDEIGPDPALIRPAQRLAVPVVPVGPVVPVVPVGPVVGKEQ